MKNLLISACVVTILSIPSISMAGTKCWSNDNNSTDMLRTNSKPGEDTKVDDIKKKGGIGNITGSESYNSSTGNTPNGNNSPGQSSTVEWSHYQPSADGETMTVTDYTRTYNENGSYSDNVDSTTNYSEDDCPRKIAEKSGNKESIGEPLLSQ